MAIRERKNPEDPIDYDDYKSMRFTRAVSILLSKFHFKLFMKFEFAEKYSNIAFNNDAGDF